MNNKGWSLNELLIGLGILTFCFVLSTILFQAKFGEHKSKMNETLMMYTYKDIETGMISSAQKYMEEKYKEKKSKEEIKITMSELRKTVGLSKYKDPKDGAHVCKGYVLVTKYNKEPQYKPYIKCRSNYQTVGYKN